MQPNASSLLPISKPIFPSPTIPTCLPLNWIVRICSYTCTDWGSYNTLDIYPIYHASGYSILANFNHYMSIQAQRVSEIHTDIEVEITNISWRIVTQFSETLPINVRSRNCMLYILNQQIYTLKLNIKPQQIVGLRPHGQQFLEAPMVDEQWEVFEEIM